jgi:hypothetical protein
MSFHGVDGFSRYQYIQNPANRTGNDESTYDTEFLASATERLSQQHECIERRRRISSGKYILFPVVVAVCSTTEEPTDKFGSNDKRWEQDIDRRARSNINRINFADLDLTINDDNMTSQLRRVGVS